MNLLPRYLFVTLLLAVTFSHTTICQEEAEQENSENEVDRPQVAESAVAAEEPSVPPSDDQCNGQIVGQSLLGQGFGQILGQTVGQSLGQTPLNAFSFMFPALNSLLSWGNLFPSRSLLGAPPPEDQHAAASKVVLVLAEDRDAAVGMSASNPEPARSARQTAPDFVSQLLQTLGQGNPAQMLQQTLPGDLSQLSQNPGQIFSQAMQQFPGAQGLQQLLQQNPGQVLSQALPNLNLPSIPGLGLLGQAGPQSEDPVVVGAPLTEGEGENVDEASAPPPPPPQSPGGFQFPNIQTAIDSGSAMIGQALGQGSSGGGIQFPNIQSAIDSGNTMLGQAVGQGSSGGGFQFPNIQSAIDSGSTMLGQALGQGSSGGSGGTPFFNLQSALDSGSAMLGQDLGQSNSEGGLPFPNIQSALDSGGAMLGQALAQGGPESGALFGLKPLQPWPQPLPPVEENPIETAASDISEVRVKPDAEPSTYTTHKVTPSAEMKLRATAQEAENEKSVPILWFRIPALSQQIYRTDTGHHSSTWKSPEDLNIESKLQAFERQVINELKQLQELERQAKEMRASTTGSTAKTMKGSAYKLNYPLSKTPVHKITREDIEKALNDEYVRKLLQKAAQRYPEDNGKFRMQHMSDADGFPMKRQTMVNDSTMKMGEKISREDIAKIMAYAYRMAAASGQEIPSMFTDAMKQENSDPRVGVGSNMGTDSLMPGQLTKQMQPDVPRQWVDPKTPQPPALIPEQRQWAEQQQMKTQTMQRQQNNAEQRQWADEKFKSIQSPEQRQWVDQQKLQQTPDHRQWAEQKMRQQQFEQWERQWAEQRQMFEQQKMQEIQKQRQKDDENIKLQMAEKRQEKSKSTPEQRQRTEQQMRTTPEQRQWAEQQTTGPWVNKQGPPHLTKSLNTQIPNQPTILHQNPMRPPFVGAATPQMPENAGKARHKDLFDEFDLFREEHRGKIQRGPPTIINYYYGQGGSRYPVYGGVYGNSQEAYRGGYGGGAAHRGSSSYGGSGAYGGGYGGGGSAGADGSYGTSYGGGAQSSNAYGSIGAGGVYRTATGDAEIEEMLRKQQQHQPQQPMPATLFRK